MSPPKRAVIYTRVSRDDSGKSTSIDTQREKCKAMVDLYEWDLVEIESDDSVSAYGTKVRPAWERVIARAEQGEIDVIVAYNMDRMTRSMTELERLILATEKHAVGVVTFEGEINLTNEMGRMVARILTAVARAEVERKGARQKRANERRREEGQRWTSGWRPFGYTLDGSVVESEADLIRAAARDVLAGTPIREIARRWREAGVRTPRSSKGADGWTHNGVRSILLNPRNAALNTYKGEVVGKGNWEAIIDEGQHARLVAMLTNPSRLTHHGRLEANLLSNIAVCGVCDAPVRGGTVGVQERSNGKSRTIGRKPVYKCPSNHLSADREDMDGIVIWTLSFILGKTSLGYGALMPLERRGEDFANLQADRDRILNELNEAATSYAKRRISIRTLETISSALQREQDEIEQRMAEHTEFEQDTRVLQAKNVRRFREMSTMEQREILARSARIRLYPKGRGKRNVPPKQQIEMDLITYEQDGSQRILRAINERPDERAVPK